MSQGRDLPALLEALGVSEAKDVSIRTDNSSMLFPARQSSRYRATSLSVNIEVTEGEAALLRRAGARAHTIL
jgi:hypothetical protein